LNDNDIPKAFFFKKNKQTNKRTKTCFDWGKTVNMTVLMSREYNK